MSTASDDEIANRPGTLRYTETPVNHPYFEHLVKRLEAVLTTIPGIGTRDHYVLACTWNAFITSLWVWITTNANADRHDCFVHDIRQR